MSTERELTPEELRDLVSGEIIVGYSVPEICLMQDASQMPMHDRVIMQVVGPDGEIKLRTQTHG